MAGERPVTRRQVLQGAASAAAVAGVGAAVGSMAVQSAEAAASEQPIRMAMHIHASFSEGVGSMQAHLEEAERVGVDVIWWTEHDHRMVARNYVEDVHFDSLTESSNGAQLRWVRSTSGQLTLAVSKIVTKPVSPNDPGGHALRLSAVSAGVTGGTHTLTADPRNYALTTSLDGTTFVVDVRPLDVGEDAWFDIVVETSYRPATGGRPAGQYTLRYRLGGGRPAGTVVETDPLNGLVVLAARVGRWTTLTLDPVADLTSLWPDTDFRDAALTMFALAVTSRNQSKSTMVVDGLHFVRVRKSPNEVLDVQRSLIDHYTPLYPTVVQHQGVELSENTPHLNWFGTPDIWPADDPANTDVALEAARVHDAGGVVSYNHPFGTSGAATLPLSTRTNGRRALARTMVYEGAFGVDILEVGHTGGRAGYPQGDYLAVWDVMSRNLVMPTGTGVTDDHAGTDWLTQRWRHVTGVWARSVAVADLQEALRRGRAWFYDPAEFSGTLDVTGAGFVPMGSAGLVESDKSILKIQATGVPSDWAVVVVSGAADEVGTSVLDPSVKTRTVPATELSGTNVKVRVPSTTSQFHRVMLRDAGGTVRAYSNPLWLLRGLPVATIPPQRWALPHITPTPTDSGSPSVDPSPSDSASESAGSDTASESPLDPVSGPATAP